MKENKDRPPPPPQTGVGAGRRRAWLGGNKRHALFFSSFLFLFQIPACVSIFLSWLLFLLVFVIFLTAFSLCVFEFISDCFLSDFLLLRQKANIGEAPTPPDDPTISTTRRDKGWLTSGAHLHANDALCAGLSCGRSLWVFFFFANGRRCAGGSVRARGRCQGLYGLRSAM